MSPAFALITDGNVAEYRIYGESEQAAPRLIQFARNSRAALLLIGRLYYVDDLRCRLRAPGCKTEQTAARSDFAALALSAYEQEGMAGLERLEGEFAICLWDDRSKRLVALRDSLGGYPLFWSHRGGKLVVSNSMRPILAEQDAPLNLDFAATFLSSHGPFQELPGPATAFESVYRVSPGGRIDTSPGCLEVRHHTFWNWEDRMIDPGPASEDELARQFGELLRSSVSERMFGRTACHLSGGMDSTAVALIAGDLLADQSQSAPLQTLSLVYEKLSELARERRYIDAVLQRRPDFQPTMIPADDLLDFDAFRDTPPHEEPYAGLWRLAMDRSTVDAAENGGAQTMLTGIGADELVDLLPVHLTDLLRNGNLGGTWRELRKWARHYNQSPWNLLRPFALNNLLPLWAIGGLKLWLRNGYANWREQSQYSLPPWLCTEFTRRHNCFARGFHEQRKYFRRGRPARLSLSLSMIESRCGDVDRWILGAPRGIGIAHPFLDQRLLSFGLGMQLRHQPRPGMAKPILSKAIGSQYPDCIRERRCKGDFSEVLFGGLSRNMPILSELISESPLAEMGVVDRNVLQECLQSVSLGATGSEGGWHKLTLTLAYMQWHAQHQKWQREWSVQRKSVNPVSPLAAAS